MGIMQSLIEQSKLPTGILGRIMLRIMNNAHSNMVKWGMLKLQPCKNILDISCGGGNAVYLMANSNRFEKIYGIDISPDAVSLATVKNRKFIKNDLAIIMQASVLKLPFENNSFDAATTFQSHYHWPDILIAMKEVYRVLKTGGQFVLIAETYKIKYHMKIYNDNEQTKTLFEETGFRNIDMESNKKCICVVGYK